MTTKALIFSFFLQLPILLFGQRIQVITNHVGYESDKPKKAIIMATGPFSIPPVRITDTAGHAVWSGQPVYCGPVSKWKNRVFWTIDFSDFREAGTYYIQFAPAAPP